jgi:hypothetical protein
MLCRYKLYLSHWMMMRKMKLKRAVLMTVMPKNLSFLLRRRYEKILTLTQVSYLTEREKMRKTNFERNSDRYVIYFLKFSLSQLVNAVIIWAVQAVEKCLVNQGHFYITCLLN